MQNKNTIWTSKTLFIWRKVQTKCSKKQQRSESKYLKSKLGTSPMSPLGVVPDGVASSHPDKKIFVVKKIFRIINLRYNLSPDPLGNGTILLHLLCKFAFYAESFQSGHFLLTYFLSEKMIILHYYLIGTTKL